MPKFLFYVGTAFCLFLALTSAAEATRELQSGDVAFVALHALPLKVTARAGWAIIVALLGGIAAAVIFVRMAALVAARNLFAAFVALFSVSAAVASLVWVLLLQTRIVALIRGGAGASDGLLRAMAEMHLAGYLMLGYFLSLSVLALRPYFRIQASRSLSALVFFPLPLFLLIASQELFLTASRAPLPASSPALLVFYAVLAVLFFAVALHCVRHRHLFIEMTNLRELLDSRVDPSARTSHPVRLGGAAFDT